MKKRVLFILGRYFPKASPNSLCVQNIIDEMSKEEYEIEILCYNDHLLTNSDIQITKISRGILQDMLYWFEDKTNYLGRIIYKLLNLIQKTRMLPFIPTWPLADPIVTKKVIDAAKKIYRKRPYHYIIPVYVPLSSIIAGHIIKKLYPQVIFIPYFLDALSGGYCPSFINERNYNKKCLRWENRLLQNADCSVFMEASKAKHDELYDRNNTLRQKYIYLDIPMLKSINECITVSTKDKIVLVYVGSIALGVRSPDYILKIISKIDNQNLEVFFVGESNCESLNKYSRLDKRVKVVGRCSHLEALEYEKKATVLINLGNSNPNLTPSKIFEYMSLGKKIISTYSIPNDCSMKYLNRYPLSLLLDENELDYDSVAKKTENFIISGYETINMEELTNNFYANTPAAFIELLHDL